MWQEKFDKAQKDVMQLKNRPSHEALLKLYGLFKQATTGDVEGEKPGFFDIKGRSKFEAWASYKGLEKDQAMKFYVELVDELIRAEQL